MLKLCERRAGAGIEGTVIGRQIEVRHFHKDRLVYGLHRLTEDEISIVEEATAR